MSAIVLKFLSGVHLGGEIRLETGTWVIGQNDSCDIVLSDQGIAARHIALSVREDGTVQFRDLDGTILTQQEDSVADGILSPKVPYKLASTFFAWVSQEEAPSVSWADMAQTLVKPVKADEPAQEAATPSSQESAEETAEKEDVTSDSEEKLPEETPEKKSKEENTPQAHSHPILGATLIGVALVAFVYGAIQGYRYLFTQDAQSQVSIFTHASPVIAAVRDAGFKTVNVEKLKSGVYSFTGIVKDDLERNRLIRLSELLPYPAAVNVTVSSDYTLPLQAAFNSLDFWPDVSMREQGKQKEILVSVYMASEAIENKGFEQAQKKTPAVQFLNHGSPLPVKRRVYHRADVEKLILQAFKKHALTGVAVEYLPGRIKWIGTNDKKIKEKAKAVREQLKTTCEVPLRIEWVTKAKEDLSTPLIEKRHVTPRVNNSMTPTFRVTSVSGGALKFVTLSTGEKCFVGGLLPGGFVLESVTFDHLVLLKNNQRIQYPLKVGK